VLFLEVTLQNCYGTKKGQQLSVDAAGNSLGHHRYLTKMTTALQVLHGLVMCVVLCSHHCCGHLCL